MATNMQEQEYLDLVIEKLHEKIAQIDERMDTNQKDMENMHDYFWENYTEFDEYGYEMYDNKQALRTSVNQQDEYVKARRRYEKMLQTPYFGRVDFCYEGEETPEIYYIGIGGLAEKRAGTAYIYDWRAPVSGLFYDYDKGPAGFEAPVGRMNGEITRKKQYKIKRGKLIYALESEMNIDDEVLQQALSEHADARLKNIVTTIQKEQNSIIRDNMHRILAVQGCAGSGKTSVALHRIAYLLYHNRKQLSAAQILILSPNSIFADYISRILPELGEENICEMTLDDFAYRELQAYGEAECRYDEIEKKLHNGESTKEAEYKQTRQYVAELERFILELESDIVDFRDFHHRQMVMREEELVTFFYEKFYDVPIFSRMEKIGEYLIDAEETLRGKTMDDEEKCIVFEKLNRMYVTRNLLELYNQFLKKTGRKKLSIVAGMIRYEDVYPLLYLKYATMNKPARREVKHLLIDEMQDYSYLQFTIIKSMFDCPMTILGDSVQTMAEKQQDVLQFLPKIFGRELHKVYLNKSYRSTSEIIEYANSLVTGDCGTVKTISIGRHGELPQEQEFFTEQELMEKVCADIAALQEMETIAVLCMDAKQARLTAERLNETTTVHLLTPDSMKFSAGVSVMPFYLAKGLEFDAVLIPHVESYTTDFHRQALYIEATRALHVLRLYRKK